MMITTTQYHADRIRNGKPGNLQYVQRMIKANNLKNLPGIEAFKLFAGTYILVPSEDYKTLFPL